MTKRIFVLVMGVTLGFTSLLLGQAGGVKAKDAALQAAIDGRQKAIDTRNGSEWSKYTADEFVTVGAEGDIQSREQRLKVQGTGPAPNPPNKVVIDSVRMFGPDTAVSIQHNSPTNNRITIVWVRQGGTWRAVSSHISVIKAAK